jgi:hypothetical protein
MTAVETITEVLTREDTWSVPSPADLAAAAFLARYSNRTFEAYRHDLRTYFQWAAAAGLEVFAATRDHIELYRATLEERGLAASTVDRRLSTVCEFSAIPQNAAQRDQPSFEPFERTCLLAKLRE